MEVGEGHEPEGCQGLAEGEHGVRRLWEWLEDIMIRSDEEVDVGEVAAPYLGRRVSVFAG